MASDAGESKNKDNLGIGVARGHGCSLSLERLGLETFFGTSQSRLGLEG